VAAAPGQATLLATPDELASQVTPYLLPGTVAQISGSMSALWAVAAAALGPEDWAVIAALPAAGLLAAAQAGLALNRTVVVPDLGACPPRVLAGLIDAFGLVIAGKLSLQASYRRRFEARLRFNGSKLITTGQWGGAKVVVDVDQTDCADLGECCGLADLPRLGYQLVCRATGAV
jgi:hypothetical protein